MEAAKARVAGATGVGGVITGLGVGVGADAGAGKEVSAGADAADTTEVTGEGHGGTQIGSDGEGIRRARPAVGPAPAAPAAVVDCARMTGSGFTLMPGCLMLAFMRLCTCAHTSGEAKNSAHTDAWIH